MDKKEPSVLRNSHQKTKLPRNTKKAQILSLFDNGVQEIGELGERVGCKPSYVASVLQSAGKISGYFDLYTHTTNPMNVYSNFFGGRVGFRTEEVAQRSVELIESFYQMSVEDNDRAAQHHALSMALTMYNRARWSGKISEASEPRSALEG
jgi:hypothetical protein